MRPISILLFALATTACAPGATLDPGSYAEDTDVAPEDTDGANEDTDGNTSPDTDEPTLPIDYDPSVLNGIFVWSQTQPFPTENEPVACTVDASSMTVACNRRDRDELVFQLVPLTAIEVDVDGRWTVYYEDVMFGGIIDGWADPPKD